MYYADKKLLNFSSVSMLYIHKGRYKKNAKTLVVCVKLLQESEE